MVISSHICAGLSRGIEQFLVFGFSFLVTPLVRGTGIGKKGRVRSDLRGAVV